MDEVTGPVIAIALVLCAVFVPTAFMAGISGQFYKQFALTIAASTVISAFNSLTLSPGAVRHAAQAARPRRARHGQRGAAAAGRSSMIGGLLVVLFPRRPVWRRCSGCGARGGTATRAAHGRRGRRRLWALRAGAVRRRRRRRLARGRRWSTGCCGAFFQRLQQGLRPARPPATARGRRLFLRLGVIVLLVYGGLHRR